MNTINAIAHDLNLCDIGMSMTRGKVRAKYIKHRKACFDAIREMNKAEGLEDMSIEDIFAELEK